MTATSETVTTDDKPHLVLAGLAQQAGYAYRLAKAGRQEEAAEHLGAIERLIVSYRSSAGQLEHDAIHKHFGLSYANYLVIPRTLLQSMPQEWQAKFVALLNVMEEAFQHVPQAEAYKVDASVEHEVSELNELEQKMLGITADWYRGESPPEGLSEADLAEWRAEHENPDGPEYYDDLTGNVLRGDDRVLLPVVDPVPHYDRGRARVEPRLGGGE